MTSCHGYSFVTKKDESEKKLELLRTDDGGGGGSSTTDPMISFDIVKGSLSANNKFYLEFGEKAPFNFFKCYPVDEKNSTLVNKTTNSTVGSSATAYVHPTVWGIAQVKTSKLDNVKAGDQYLAMLPIGESVSFDKAHVDEAEGTLIVDRPETNPGYNVFTKIRQDEPDVAYANPKYSDLALACFPGIVTGFHLSFRLNRNDFYGADTVVMTAASSKVSLALAVFLREFPAVTEKKVRLIGYTSSSNKEFCEKTGLYDDILGYDDLLSDQDSKCVMIDVSGRAQSYQQNKKSILKNFVIGNASGTDEKKATFSSFTAYETMKLVLLMMGAPTFILNWMSPIQELYLIPPDAVALKKEWGLEKYNKTYWSYGLAFCKAAEKWISVRKCDSESSIEQAFVDIVAGSVPPNEAIILDTIKAVKSRKK